MPSTEAEQFLALSMSALKEYKDKSENLPRLLSASFLRLRLVDKKSNAIVLDSDDDDGSEAYKL